MARQRWRIDALRHRDGSRSSEQHGLIRSRADQADRVTTRITTIGRDETACATTAAQRPQSPRAGPPIPARMAPISNRSSVVLRCALGQQAVISPRRACKGQDFQRRRRPSIRVA